MHDLSVYSRLLSYRTREDISSRENFLTEAVAYTLQRERRAAIALVRRVLPENRIVDDDATVVVRTQESSVTSDRRHVRPDMVVEVGGSHPATVLFEHKWDSIVDGSQLEQYKALAAESGHDVAFVCARFVDKRNAAEAIGNNRAVLLWEDVFDVVKTAAGSEPVVTDLLSFMKEQGLGRQTPLTPVELEAYAYSAGVNEKCARLAQIVATAQWSELADCARGRYFDDPPKNGRVGIKLNLFRDWDIPYLFLGILLNASHYRLNFASGMGSGTLQDRPASAGPDVVLMLDAHVRQLDLSHWSQLHDCAARIRDDETQLTTCSGEWRAMVVQKPLLSVLRGRGADVDELNGVDDQGRAISETLASWLTTLDMPGLIRDLKDRYRERIPSSDAEGPNLL